ncbi:sugar ABC transporter ATP-binding protein [Clostridium sp. AM58-1XD]|uniref:sugar ABC transporter ATP-binding protein n=1 Tax=Clostridium sp. AM58-1XD TaxID=2292307 RepID=UPI000E4D7F77|nr:sugar ABC transporter ATP-binding protein [Clostridium sp. AM58-1XD]RGY98578.1 sugar ABC transporter ATP-binding protein [Clostridium sp. AM58-1XD]
MSDKATLSVKNVSKSFSGVQALQNFSMDCFSGEVHVLMGENGAGKSTLLKILTGNHQADTGQIFIDGKEIHVKHPVDAIQYGISMIYQEIHLCQDLTIAENIYRGREITKGLLVDFKEMERKAQFLLDSLDMDVDASMMVSELSIAQQQMVEIAGALSVDAKILILDEATASLTEKEVQALFQTIRSLTAKGVVVIYVSHRMNETFEIGDRVTVLRDGQYIATKKIQETTEDELIELMVGRPLEKLYSQNKPVGKEVVLEVKNFRNSKLKDVSISLRKGEILGLSGLVGAGRTELARAIFGLDELDSGELFMKGEKVVIKRPQDAIRAHIALVPEDRKKAGLVLMNSVGFNLTLTVLREFIKGPFIDRKKEDDIINTYKNSLSIKMADTEQEAGSLSGGNQQKIVISKWLATKPEILIMDEPTRGIDVGAKAEIYDLMFKLAEQGISIILISSDLPEIINLSSRVAVMHEGRIMTVLDSVAEELTQPGIMKYATGRNE